VGTVKPLSTVEKWVIWFTSVTVAVMVFPDPLPVAFVFAYFVLYFCLAISLEISLRFVVLFFKNEGNWWGW
jgi:hypothetical protein